MARKELDMAEVGVEWINDYDHLNTLTHEHTDAGGLYDELQG
jgi:hypothetical protein